MTKHCTVCIHQFFRPSSYIRVDGVGDCTICEPDDDNKNCKSYHPITISTLVMEE